MHHRSRVRARLLAVVGAVLSSIAMSATNASDLVVQTADGPRHAIVVAQTAEPAPTVIVLHGALGTAAYTQRTSGFAEAAARHGFTAVFADGIDRQWNDGRTGGHRGPDDVAFLRALVARLVADRIARPDRIHLAGISNGGMMTFTMACKAGELFAGIGTIIANLPAGVEPCAPKPMPVIMVNGTADPMVPYRGGPVGLRGGRGTVLGVDQTTALFAKVDGCSGDPVAVAVARRDTASTTSATKITWAGCSPGTSLTLYRVDGGGHGVPGRAESRIASLGPVSADFDAADVIIEVFAAAR